MDFCIYISSYLLFVLLDFLGSQIEPNRREFLSVKSSPIRHISVFKLSLCESDLFRVRPTTHHGHMPHAWSLHPRGQFETLPGSLIRSPNSQQVSWDLCTQGSLTRSPIIWQCWSSNTHSTFVVLPPVVCHSVRELCAPSCPATQFHHDPVVVTSAIAAWSLSPASQIGHNFWAPCSDSPSLSASQIKHELAHSQQNMEHCQWEQQWLAT